MHLMGTGQFSANHNRLPPNGRRGPTGLLLLAWLVHLVSAYPLLTFADDIPLAKFSDITASAGIHFSHVNGAYGEKLLP